MYYNKKQCWISIGCNFIFFGGGAKAPPPVGHGILIHEVSTTHTKTHHSRQGIVWTSDQLVTETSTWQHTTLTTDIHMPRWDSNPQSQQASGRKLTPQTARPLRTANNLYLLATLTVRHANRTTHTATSNESKTHEERVSNCRILGLSVNKFNVIYFHMSCHKCVQNVLQYNNNINILQLGCHPVAVVILHVHKTWNWLLLNLSLEGYMRSM